MFIQETNEKRTIWIILDDVTINILINTNVESVVTEFYIYDRKINISLDFYHRIFLSCSKNF